mmetsp:Transcript_22651/g.67438  ORF Transcript_22651/g.67438 Transcript_22651/m.67438 type:complete len:256 (+) Transcript_22651:2183-2950(+)
MQVPATLSKHRHNLAVPVLQQHCARATSDEEPSVLRRSRQRANALCLQYLGKLVCRLGMQHAKRRIRSVCVPLADVAQPDDRQLDNSCKTCHRAKAETIWQLPRHTRRQLQRARGGHLYAARGPLQQRQRCQCGRGICPRQRQVQIHWRRRGMDAACGAQAHQRRGMRFAGRQQLRVRRLRQHHLCAVCTVRDRFCNAQARARVRCARGGLVDTDSLHRDTAVQAHAHSQPTCDEDSACIHLAALLPHAVNETPQ